MRTKLLGTALLQHLSALPITLILLLLLIAGSWLASQAVLLPTLAVGIPLGLLGLNLVAALVVRFNGRVRPAILALHGALLAVIVLTLVSRLTYLRGWLELVEGESFTGTLIEEERGPWHDGGLAELVFRNEGFTTHYLPGHRRSETQNAIGWPTTASTMQHAVIGDNRPLVLRGYRIYTTANKGFAPLFAWESANQAEVNQGAVNLPSFPMFYDQSTQWTIPNTRLNLTTRLVFAGNPFPVDQSWNFHIPEQHHLELKLGDEVRIMRPGEVWEMNEGRLTYLELKSWMGYRVFYDPTTPWMMAALLVLTGSLLWLLKERFAATPWQVDAQTREHGHGA